MKKINIIFLLHLPPPVHGSSVVGLSIKESTIINSEFNSYYINLLSSKNVAESGIVNLSKILGFIFIWFKVLASIIRKHPRLCYLALTTTGAGFYKDILLVFLLKIFRIKRIYHLHNKGVSLYQDKTINRICYSYVFRDAEVILLSKYLYSDIQAFVPESKVHICHNGVPDRFGSSKFKIQSRQLFTAEEIYQNEQKVVQILFLSNLIKAKGVFILLEACALLKKKGIPYKCIFIGGEGDITISQFYDKVNQLGLNKQVSYTGKRYGEEKYKAFAESDIFGFPTYYETFGLVNLEAMQYSLPIVSTFEGGIRDIIEDQVTGFLVPQKDVEALAEKLTLLITNTDLRHKMGAAGRKKYEREFTQEIFEHRLVEIFHQVIKEQYK